MKKKRYMAPFVQIVVMLSCSLLAESGTQEIPTDPSQPGDGFVL